MSINHVYRPLDHSIALYIDGQCSRRPDNKVSDLSGNRNHGIITGAVYKNAPDGKSVFSFDGIDDYIRIPPINKLNDFNKVTLAAWVYFRTFVPLSRILAKGNSTSDLVWVLGIDSSILSPRMYTINENNNIVNTVATKVLTLNKWHLMSGTYDGSFNRIFIDGVQDPNKNVQTGKLRSNTFSVSINRTISGTNGMVGEVYVFNDSLTPSSQMDLFNSTRQKYGR